MTYTNTPTISHASLQETNIAPQINGTLLALIILILLLLPLTATAQDKCTTIGNNPKWIDGMQQLIETMQSNDMQKAKIQSKKLADICPNAPALNYLQGKIAEALGEKQDALYYYQKASENTYTFAVDPDNAKKIWYARYENEHPERTAAAVNSSHESINDLEAEITKLKDINSKYKETVENNAQTVKKLMWSGVGIGIGGLALAGAGVGMAIGQDNKYSVKTIEHNSNVQAYTFSTPYTVSWAIIGAGAVLTVTGAVLAGIFGKKYASSSKDETNDYSFSITPLSTSFTYRF